MKKLISTILLLSAPSIFAESIGTVLFTAQTVTAQNAGATRSLTRGAPLEVGDAIVTAADASAKIKYANGTLVTIGPGSNYKIVSYSPKQGDIALTAELNKGKIESDTNGKAKREALKTPVVALAVSGTSFKVYVANSKQTNVELITGEVTVGNQIMTPGPEHSVVATPQGVSSAPFPAAGNIVITPEMAAATSSSSSTTSTSSSSTLSSTSLDAQTSGAAATDFLNSTTVSSQAVSANTAVTSALIATFSIQCLPD